MAQSTLVIISGASRGLGEALARGWLAKGCRVLGVSRTTTPALAGLAAQHAGRLNCLQADLADPQATRQAAVQMAHAIAAPIEHCILVNNAGTVQPVAHTQQLTDAGAITAALSLNLTSVMLITAAVLDACQTAGIDCRVLNISSGAGRSPVSGWGVYCASKAGLDMYTRVLALEHPGLRIASLAPGVIDTDMQAQIRQSDPGAFPGRPHFIAMHEQGELSAPQAVADRIIRHVDSDAFGAEILDDIRHHS